MPTLGVPSLALTTLPTSSWAQTPVPPTSVRQYTACSQQVKDTQDRRPPGEGREKTSDNEALPAMQTCFYSRGLVVTVDPGAQVPLGQTGDPSRGVGCWGQTTALTPPSPAIFSPALPSVSAHSGYLQACEPYNKVNR